eukprot:15332855-Ditylum_brightwellii.AAC.1
MMWIFGQRWKKKKCQQDDHANVTLPCPNSKVAIVYPETNRRVKVAYNTLSHSHHLQVEEKLVMKLLSVVPGQEDKVHLDK